MNVATTSYRFNSLLCEREDLGLGLEGLLREQGCSVDRTQSVSAENVAGHDLVVIAANGIPEEDVIAAVQAHGDAEVLVITDSTDLAVKAARLGAQIMMSSSRELVGAQIGHVLTTAELKRKVARQNGGLDAPSSSAHRRSTPLPKEAMPEALDGLIEAAEHLVPMHRFQRVYVDYALRRFGGNKVHTAAALGIDRRTIQRWARARAERAEPQTDHATS